MNFDTIATITLVVILIGVLFFNRKNLIFQRWGIFFAALYRSKAGLRTMDHLAKKYTKFWHVAAPWIIGLGFLGMVVVTADLAYGLFRILAQGASPSVGVVLPIEAKGVFYVPFFYWIISLFIIVVLHEGMHGVMARVYNLPVKNSGLMVLGALVPLIPGAFVEPDEKKLVKASPKKQLAVYAAGPAINIVTGLLFLVLFLFVITPFTDTFYAKDGVVVTDLMGQDTPAAHAGIKPGEKITQINGQAVRQTEDFMHALEGAQPGDAVNIVTSNAVYDVTLARNPDTNNALLGVFIDNQLREPNWAVYSALWLQDLLFWLALLSLGVGLFNLVPLGPIDGGRMLLTAMEVFTHKKRAATVWKSVSFTVLGILLTNIALAFL